MPSATENLPIVLSGLGDTSELGGTDGVSGATRLISDHVFSASWHFVLNMEKVWPYKDIAFADVDKVVVRSRVTPLEDA